MSLALHTLTSRDTHAILMVAGGRGSSLLQADLFRSGYRVDFAATIPEACDYLVSRPYSLVICDHTIGDGGRHDLLAHLSRQHPELPCVFTSFRGNLSQFLGLIGPAAGPGERLERERQRSSRVTRSVLEGTISAMIAAIDARDPYNGTHSQRVTLMALRLGQALGLGAEDLETLELSALLHDVGKIAVPKRILAKPGPLDDEEWAAIREHPALGAQILQSVEPLRDVAAIVHRHHEHVDGSGYPDGLAGDRIPLLARLIAIVDAYEAMTAHRAYRRAMGRDQARDLIHAGLGAHFDRTLGEIFLSLEDLP